MMVWCACAIFVIWITYASRNDSGISRLRKNPIQSPTHILMSNVHAGGFEQFHQDTATHYTSRIASEWLQEHSSDLRHFHSQPKSPGMNTIEYIWYVLQSTVEKRSLSPQTPTDLQTALQHSWYEFPPSYIQILIESISRPLANNLRDRGGLHDITQLYQIF